MNTKRTGSSARGARLIRLAVMAAMLLVMPSLHAYTLMETHTIILVSTVPSEPTAFRLVYDADLSQATATNASGIEFRGSESYSGGQVNVRSLSEADVDIVFRTVIANGAKEFETYELCFSAGPFKAKAGGLDHDVEPNLTHTAATASESGRGYSTELTTDPSQELTKPSDKVYSVRVTMDGATCNPGSELAQFRVHYDRDESIDPSSEGYSASIRMEIHTI